MKKNEIENKSVLIEGTDISIEQLIAIAQRTSALMLSDRESFRTRISRGAEFVDRLIAEDGDRKSVV